MAMGTNCGTALYARHSYSVMYSTEQSSNWRWADEASIAHVPAADFRPRRLNRYSDSLQADRSGYRIPVRARFSAPVQTSLLGNVHRVFFPGVKRPGRAVDQHHLAMRLKKE